MTAEGETILQVEGQGCKRGYAYACAEYTHPMRILTSTVRVAGSKTALLPVRSASPVPKEKLFACMEAVRSASVTPPVLLHDVVIPNVAGTGVDMIAAAEI